MKKESFFNKQRIKHYPNKDDALIKVAAENGITDYDKHSLRAEESVAPHYHKKTDEWIIIDFGEFRVRLEEEQEKFHLKNEAISIHIPAGKKHAFLALSPVSYFVLRKQKDATIYAKRFASFEPRS